jgi:hypothetical protein
MSTTHDIYIEAGEKKVIAVSLQWPGWTRMAKDEGEVLQTMLKYAARYAVIPQKAKLDFTPPEKFSDFKILYREPGNKTTDFGVPITFLPEDWEKVDEQELARMQTIMRACWEYFDEGAAAAEGKQLQKGPRGGGRDLDKIINHVVDAEEAYLKTLGAPWKAINNEPVEEKKQRLRKAAFEGMRMKLDGLLPAEGPRGGKRWPVPYYVRRLAWHVVDHTWEVEDRVMA